MRFQKVQTSTGYVVRAEDGSVTAVFSGESSEDAAIEFLRLMDRLEHEKSMSPAEIASRAAEAGKPALRAEYWSDVRSTAESIQEELTERLNDGERGEDLREWLMEHIHESLDGHSRVIYTSNAIECLLFSNNDGQYFEQFGADGAVSDGTINWSTIAFSAFEADVMAQLDSNDVDVNEPDKDTTFYEVDVSNIGNVYKGIDEDKARETFAEYVSQSKSGIGRAGNENVTLYANGDEEDEYVPEVPVTDEEITAVTDGAVSITFREHGTEESKELYGSFSGERDTWGKWTFTAENGSVYYLFTDEIKAIEE